jgi:hypothetical protein
MMFRVSWADWQIAFSFVLGCSLGTFHALIINLKMHFVAPVLLAACGAAVKLKELPS